MIVRIVKMQFNSKDCSAFQELFESRKAEIRSFTGCIHLELWRDTTDPTIFFTYSIWQSQAALDKYRFSDFFKDTWTQTRKLFHEKAQAWSVQSISRQ
ncbi:MAG: antibiotic biosynthesis monooxygenase [Bacteroidetes bacterium]|nr:antibiotic biosynthesis monooxygenase [Bacteroidota bacterium]MBS1738961.1 antibiotic biosynthesis monooxygenase [Bacteroidota bacterium]MBS1775460.1 antibiotic biosynthesis monooxygenase [Bacteroidota bacterium]